MECVMGMVGRDFAVVVVDTSAVQSILVHKTDEDKIMLLDSHKLMGVSGEPGDHVQFTEFIQKNFHLYQFRNNMALSSVATANFTRNKLATALCKINLRGLDGIQGPVYVGTGCVFNRTALYGYEPSIKKKIGFFSSLCRGRKKTSKSKKSL